MKVLMINVVCGIRSTGRICTDLAVALEKQGHTVKIGYGRENVPEQYKKYSVKIDSNLDIKLHGIKARLFDADGLGSINATRKFIRWVEVYDPDVIHLHNLHGYYINVPMLFEYIIKHQKKVIWTLHDCWSFTGHSGTCDQVGCEKWVNGCNKCPLSNDYPKSYIDRSNRNYEWKKKLFTEVDDLLLVTPSKWLSSLVKKSFLKEKKIKVIPNGIDIKQFHPLMNDFRTVYKIENKIMILGCASTWGKSKGLEDFKQLANKLDDRFKIVLVGLTKEQINSMPLSIICIEQTQSVKELAQIYSAADLFVNLTYADNYPTVNLEALACGTPVLTYRTGGSSECLSGNNGISFERGDLDGVLNFLLNEFERKKFTVEDIAVESFLSKDTSLKEYSNALSKSGGGYFFSRIKYGVNGTNMILGVASAWGERKGIDVFIKLANDLPEKFQIFMVGITEDLQSQLPKRIHVIERTNDRDELRELYSIADVFLNPTIQDNYPTVNLEAIACDTPVITYQTGGSPENSFTPSCVVVQKDYEAIKSILINKKYERALKLSNRDQIGKECMMEQYCEAYIED